MFTTDQITTNRRFVLNVALAGVALLTAVLSTITPAAAAVFTVGADEACDFGDLQEALWGTWLNDITGPTADEIRIARNQSYLGEYIIKEQDVTLRGGYDDCSDTTPSGHTIIHRPAGLRHFQVSASALSSTGYRRQVDFRDLFLTLRGEVSLRIPFGGSLHVSGHVWMTLYGTVIEHGHADYGGGIYVDGTDNAFVSLKENSMVRASSAVFGGGVACHGNLEEPGWSGGGIGLTEGGILTGNQAAYGGGAYAHDCGFGGGNRDYNGVFLNTALEDGGGVYAEAGALVQPMHVMGNVARRGGGVFVTGEGTEMIDHSGRIVDNEASEDGGGVFVEEGAVAVVFIADSNCEYFGLDITDCALVASNRAGGRGGAVFAQSGGIFRSDARFTKNSASQAAVAYVVDEGSSVEISNAEIFANEGDVMVDLAEGGRFKGLHLTIAENYPFDGETWYFHAIEDPVELQNVIFSDLAGQVHNGPWTWSPIRRCLLVPTSTHDPGGDYIRVGDPDYLDPSADDYQVGPNSAAVDLCPTAPLGGDRLRNLRPVDLLDFPNWWGVFDAGAYERQPAEESED